MSPHKMDAKEEVERVEGEENENANVTGSAGKTGSGYENSSGKTPAVTTTTSTTVTATPELERKNWLLGAKFDATMPHHAGIKALWETKWRFPCSVSVYPFHDGKMEDFEPVFAELIANNTNSGTSAAYTRAFFAPAQLLTAAGDAATAANDTTTASALYLRAACLYRIARFPYITHQPRMSCAHKWAAWTAQKAVYLKAASTWTPPVAEVVIPHAAAKGRDGASVPLYVRYAPAATVGPGLDRKEPAAPVVLLMTGLDGYRPDNTGRLEEFAARGWACVVAEVPGTADCPADAADPESPDRLWTSVLDWMEGDGRFDMARVMVWGLSTGGYYAVRVAHTHKQRLRGVVAQGAGVHWFFDEDWLEKADGHEYPFLLSPAMAMKHGFESVEDFKKGAQKKFSLLETGILKMESTRLLLINGMDDGLMPIEDSMLLFEHGTPKEARFFSNALHMGYPLANNAVYPWMEKVMH